MVHIKIDNTTISLLDNTLLEFHVSADFDRKSLPISITAISLMKQMHHIKALEASQKIAKPYSESSTDEGQSKIQEKESTEERQG